MVIQKENIMRLWRRNIAMFLIFTVFMNMIPCGFDTYAAEDYSLNGTVTVSETEVSADGISETIVSLLLKDEAGNNLFINPDRIMFSSTLGNLDGIVIYEENGQYNSVLTAPTTAGTAYISAKVDGKVVPDIATVNFKEGTASPAHSILNASSLSLPADGISQTEITFLMKDQYGNNVADKADSLQLFTTTGDIVSVNYETHSEYKTRIVSPEYGVIGSWTGSPGLVDELNLNFEQGVIPVGTPNTSAIPTSIYASYETQGYYKAIITAPTTPGGTTITAKLNGVSVNSSVYVEFIEAVTTDPGTGTGSDPGTGTGDDPGTGTGSDPGTGTGSDPGTGGDPGNGTGNMGNIPISPTNGTSIEIIRTDGQSSKQEISSEDIKRGNIEIKMSSDGGEINISEANIKAINAINPDTVIEIKTNSASMSIPISELDPTIYSMKYNIPEEAIRFEVIIREPKQSSIQAIEQSVKDIQAEILAPPFEFEVQVLGNNGQSAFISSFNRYVSRSLQVNSDSISETATGVWWVPGSNQFRFVPTHFEQKDGQWWGVMKRKGASIYTIIDRPVSFTDVKDHWSSKDVELLASKLIIKGRSEEVFEPNASVTRAEIAALLVRSLGLDESDKEVPFSDVNGEWYKSAISTAYQVGLISGYKDGMFRPNQNITREELISMIIRAMNYTDAMPNSSPTQKQQFKDELSISAWALEDVKIAHQLDIVKGHDGKFNPANNSTRAEAVSMLKRMLELVQFI